MPTVALTMVDSGHNFFRDVATGADSAKTTYFAVGNGTSATTHGMNTLVNEQFRKSITSVQNGINIGETLVNCFLSNSDAVGFDIEEVAIFSGVSASATANSGRMIGRALWTHNPKTATESIQLQLDLTL